MELNSPLFAVLLFSLLTLFSCMEVSTSTSDGRRAYIIHMDTTVMPTPFSDHENWYTSMLSSVSLAAADSDPPTHLYTYSHVMHGFSAVLSEAQLEHLENMPGHVATYAESFAELHTTHTPKFLGLNRHSGLWPVSNFGDDMIIGIIDTGVWPESKSFNDKGMPPVPTRWKGTCETGVRFDSSHCNRKLIGARSFSKGMQQIGHNVSNVSDYNSPRDFFGHGTHTSSIAAGARVIGTDFFEYAKGTAIGIAPRARIAMYKVLFIDNTLKAVATDMLAGMDQAIADGVDLMSLSLGFPPAPEYHSNPIAIGAFAAMEKGIFVSCSAGNSGPDPYSIINGAPWITTVGAGTVDRDYAATVTLGDGTTVIQGNSLYLESLFVSGVDLYYGSDDSAKNCQRYSLDPRQVAGKIVLCDFSVDNDPLNQTMEVANSSALAAIIVSNQWRFMSFGSFDSPAVIISLEDVALVKEYLKKTTTPTVDITFKLTVLGTKPAPQVAYFSSRGPNAQSPMVLKPDILAPGVHILAAWARAPDSSLATVRGHDVISDYMLLSGTSMSSPHIVGVAALLKSLHRDWSPAAIRSAMMTTAYVLDNTHGTIVDQNTSWPATPLDFGAGHVNPEMAMDPGLVYDAGVQDYIDFLCGLNYTSAQMKAVTRSYNYTCDANRDVNYPSFIVISDRGSSYARRSFKRVLTSVTAGASVYRVAVSAPKNMRVVVSPETLSFHGENSKQEFTVSVEVDRRPGDAGSSYGFLVWNEVGGKHTVRSPIVSASAPDANNKG